MSDKRNTTVHTSNNDKATVQAAVAQLTVKGMDAMESIGKGFVSFFDDGVVEHSGIWGDCLTGDLGHKSSGVINRLRDLGLLSSYDTTGDEYASGMWWSLTALGADVANFLAGNLDFQQVVVEEPAAPVVTTKVGTKWTYIYVDGDLVAEVRNDAAALVVATLSN